MFVYSGMEQSIRALSGRLDETQDTLAAAHASIAALEQVRRKSFCSHLGCELKRAGGGNAVSAMIRRHRVRILQAPFLMFRFSSIFQLQDCLKSYGWAGGTRFLTKRTAQCARLLQLCDYKHCFCIASNKMWYPSLLLYAPIPLRVFARCFPECFCRCVVCDCYCLPHKTLDVPLTLKIDTCIATMRVNHLIVRNITSHSPDFL